MRVFVSSRMGSILERKSAIDSIHLARHRPLYIETEEYIALDKHKQDSSEYTGAVDKMKNLMLAMIKKSDLFVGVYSDEDPGIRYDALGGLTPINFELKSFLDLLEERDLLNEAHERIFLFRSKSDGLTWVESELHRKNLAKQPQIYEFQADDLIGLIFDRLRHLEPERHYTSMEKADFTIDIEYHGTDQADLLRTVSEYLFTKHAMNIDHVWGSSKGEIAMINFSASWIGDGEDLPNPEDLEIVLKQRVAKLLQKEDWSIIPLKVHTRSTEGEETAYGYVEVRCIDAPGQLNTICKAMMLLELNMTQIHLAPAPPEFPRQTVIAITVALDKEGPSLSRRAHFLRLESKLRDLVGVRAIGTRLSRPLTTDEDS